MKFFLLISCFSLLYLNSFSQTWVQKASMPAGNAGYYPISFSIAGKLYVGGGYANGSVLNSFFVYDPATNTWSSRANMPDALYAAAFFVLNGMGYIVCGQDQSMTSNAVYMYNPTTDTWTQKNNFPGTARYNTIGFSFNGKGYMYEGFIGSLLNDMWEYEPTSDTWIQKANAPGPPRDGPTAIIINNQVYVGLGSNVSATSFYNDFYRFDPVANTYTQVANSPGARNAPAHFPIGSLGYIGLGLIGANFSPSVAQDFTTYDPATNTWVAVNNFGGAPRGWVFSEIVGGKPYVGAGSYLSNGIFYSDNWTWDICTLNINLGNDTTICAGSSFTLSDTITNATFLWNTGATSSAISVTTSGRYWLQVTQNGCIGSDTINVTFAGAPAAFHLGNDTVYCGDFTRTLSTGIATTTWSTGATAPSIIASAEGLYWAQDSTSCGVRRDSIHLMDNPLPSVDLGNDTNLCKGNTLLLNATTPAAAYQWQDGTTMPTLSVDTQGLYWVDVTVHNCDKRDSIVVNYLNPPDIISLSSDTTICEDSLLVLNVYEPYARYHWSTDDTSYSIRADQPGIYTVTVSNVCGSASAAENIDVKQCTCKLAIPTAFSPNGDGKNDKFGVLTACPIENYELHIYNRWGQLIYTSTTIMDRWDGKYKNAAQPIGVFVWYIRYTDPYTSQRKSLSGNVTLLR